MGCIFLLQICLRHLSQIPFPLFKIHYCTNTRFYSKRNKALYKEKKNKFVHKRSKLIYVTTGFLLHKMYRYPRNKEMAVAVIDLRGRAIWTRRDATGEQNLISQINIFFASLYYFCFCFRVRHFLFATWAAADFVVFLSAEAPIDLQTESS